jgi:hypothetical protein
MYREGISYTTQIQLSFFFNFYLFYFLFFYIHSLRDIARSYFQVLKFKEHFVYIQHKPFFFFFFDNQERILLKQARQTSKHFTCESKEQQNILQHKPTTQYKLSFQNNKTTLQHSLTKFAHKPIFCKSRCSPQWTKKLL